MEPRKKIKELEALRLEQRIKIIADDAESRNLQAPRAEVEKFRSLYGSQALNFRFIAEYRFL